MKIMGRLPLLFHPEQTHLAVMMTPFPLVSKLLRPFRGTLIKEVMTSFPLGLRR